MNNRKDLKVKIVSGLDDVYKYTSVADITSIISNMFGVKVKLAYLIIDSANDKNYLSTNAINVNINQLEDGIYIKFDDKHKVMIEPSEWITISKVN